MVCTAYPWAALLADIRRITRFARQNELRFAEYIGVKQGKEAQREIAALQFACSESFPMIGAGSPPAFLCKMTSVSGGEKREEYRKMREGVLEFRLRRWYNRINL